MEDLTVACVQQRMRVPESITEYREDLQRFLRVAATKRARLVVFPELAGTMVAPPLLAGFQADLLKRADRARRRDATLWQKLNGEMASVALQLLKVQRRRLLAGLIHDQAPRLWEIYQELFGGLAKEFDLTLVAPSGYFPDPLDGVIRNLSAVFGPNGDLLGYQTKGVLHRRDEDLAQPGGEWRVIGTDVGRIGVMVGSDMLYPEVGRLLAYQGAEIFVGQAAATDRALYEKLRSAMLARMQENQLFAALSFLVGPNEFGREGDRSSFVGKSAILAPQELTPKESGVLVEMTSARSESVLAAVWEFPALQRLWEESDTPMRSNTPLEQVGPVLASLYQQLRRLPKRSDPLALPQRTTADSPSELHSLDELPVLASVTARWPLEQSGSAPTAADPDFDLEDEAEALSLQESSGEAFLRSARNHAGDESAAEAEMVEEETQEMDALLEPSPEDDHQQK